MLSTVARRAAARRVPTFAPIMARGYAENAFGCVVLALLCTDQCPDLAFCDSSVNATVPQI